MIRAVSQGLFYPGIFCMICDFSVQFISIVLHCVVSYLQYQKRKSETIYLSEQFVHEDF